MKARKFKNAVTFYMTDEMYHSTKLITKIEKLTMGEFMRDAVELALDDRNNQEETRNDG
jgi:hypothetical protein